MTNTVNINFQNCYGIKNLSHSFDMDISRHWLIYAPNGVMKTSFAKTFQAIMNGTAPSDRVYPDRVSTASIMDGDGNKIEPDQIFVIEPYNQSYRSRRISALAVNSRLKSEYDAIYESVSEKRSALVKSLASSSGLKKYVEAQFCADFNLSEKQFFVAMGRIEREVKRAVNPDFSTIKYASIFNDKVIQFLSNPENLKIISEYTSAYDSLLGASTYFKRGIFNHNNASTVAKNLKSNGWFASGHTVRLKSTKEAKFIELATEKELESIIQKEKDEIINDKKLAIIFDNLDRELQKNAELREFREFLVENKGLLPEISDINAFRQKLWIAYISDNLPLYTEMMSEYDRGEERIKSIVAAAKLEATKWLRVIEIFNERFTVPFIVRMDNQDDVILRSEAPIIVFDFKDPYTSNAVPLEESRLYDVLSNGEKRALYILNIIFEVEGRRESGQKTIFVIDDIADSFDYKNKYAIIEYIKDISRDAIFSQIILTHNFDFYRTVGGRLAIVRDARLHTVKTMDGVSFTQEKYQNNPFIHWRKHLTQPEMLIASIPFVRNLAEYCGHKAQEDELTSLLHIKTNTHLITIKELESTFNAVLSADVRADLSDLGHENIVLHMIYRLCASICAETSEVVELEKKIVLAIGIRLKAEAFMIAQISDPIFVAEVQKNQTYALTEKYKSSPKAQAEKIEILERVSIMTPENIHLNSFMYEPLLDMSNEYLKKLYADVANL